MADDRARTPKPAVQARDARALNLAPDEGILLSRIDGVLTENELAELLGLDGGELGAMLDKLASLGLVTLDGVDTSGRMSAAASADGEDIELEPEQRARVLALFAELETIDHYAVLGVEPGAEKKAIKRAYYELTAQFHPDRFFRKRLGAFKPKMEAIFKRITEAHDVLTDKARRAEYDAYLADQRSARGIETMLKDVLAEMAAAEQAVKQSVAEQAPLDLRPSAPPAAVATAPAPAPAPRPLPRPSSPQLSEQAKREALARRLFGGRPPPRPAAPAAPIARQPPTPEEAMDALRRRYEERVAHARAAQAKKYSDEAEAALAKNDPIAAANALRVAASMAPDDAELRARADEAQRQARTMLADTYLRQAEYEEKSEHWSEAAKSWSRVADARPDNAHAHERAAHCIVKASGDLHEAGRLALKACGMQPQNATFRVTLAHVYLAAGLTLNAKRELEAAQQLSPTDDTIQALLKRVAKP